jgi:hypothetical protein
LDTATVGGIVVSNMNEGQTPTSVIEGVANKLFGRSGGML